MRCGYAGSYIRISITAGSQLEAALSATSISQKRQTLPAMPLVDTKMEKCAYKGACSS